MKKLILISNCESVKKVEQKGWRYEFHFKGAYKGNHINRVFVQTIEKKFECNKEYMLYLNTEAVLKQSMYCNLIKSKMID